jgi:tetratricopeptide (TPR) repeat protein
VSHDPVEDLRAEIARGRVLAIVGAGVSIQATGGNRLASWIGLLEDGVDRCLAVAGSLPDGWGDRVRAEIRSGDMDDLLSAAEKISRKLGAPDGEYRRWLRETFESLNATDPSVLEALRDLGIPLATTNYDGLLEEVTGLDPVTWREGAAVERVVRGDDRAILHLHGYWKNPESVILGIRSYEEVLGDAHAQNVLRALRTVNTLLFVGCGEGLADPNFGALLRWTQEIFVGSEYRHYRLCRVSERDDLQRKHPPEERIHVLPYGPNFSDFAPFLRSLRPAVTKTDRKEEEKPSPSLAEGRPFRLPPLPRCFGRGKEVEDLVATLLTDSPPPVPILGGPGIGKSTVTLAALHDARVAKRFGARRYFVRCDSARSREALVGEIATTLRIEPGPNLEERLLLDLESASAVLALDNTETPWDADTTAVEDLLSQLGGIPVLALIASIRGEQRPPGPTWREAIRVGPLNLDPARRAFLAVAGERYRNDPDLDRLLEAVDRLPLAVTLLAHQAEGEPDLSGIWKRWQEERVALLRRADGKERLTNLEVSLELSIQGPRMTDPARHLLSFLGILPDGVAREDVPALLPEEGEAAASTLRRVGLVLSDDPRLRVLAPVREYVRKTYLPADEDLERIIGFYLELAILGDKAGWEGGTEAIQRLTPEIGNLEAIMLHGLASPDPKPAILAALSMGEFSWVTGLGTTVLLERARGAAQPLKDGTLEARCLVKIGDIALYRSDPDDARQRYEEALPLCKRVGDLFGQAYCIQRLGDIALRRSNHDDARQRYEEAIPLYERIGDLPGQANCIKGLGDIALYRSNHDDARQRYEEAIPLYKRAGDPLGQANCIRSLGDIALFFRSDHDDACQRYEEAIPLYKRAGSLLGQANCIQGLGHAALNRSDHDTARERYEEAIPIYKRVGDLLGQANCIQGLGDIAWARSDRDTGQRLFREALGLYELLQEPSSIGETHLRLARAALTPEERREHIEAAREASTRIKRPDLVKKLDEEFGETKGDDPPAAPLP